MAGLEAMRKAAQASLKMLKDTENEQIAQAVRRITEAEERLMRRDLLSAQTDARQAVALWPEYEGGERLLKSIESEIRKREESSRKQAEHVQKQREIEEVERMEQR